MHREENTNILIFLNDRYVLSNQKYQKRRTELLTQLSSQTFGAFSSLPPPSSLWVEEQPWLQYQKQLWHSEQSTKIKLYSLKHLQTNTKKRKDEGKDNSTSQIHLLSLGAAFNISCCTNLFPQFLSLCSMIWMSYFNSCQKPNTIHNWILR